MIKKKFISTGQSAHRGYNMKNISKMSGTISDKLNQLGISDAEEFIALWSIEEIRKELTEFLETSESEILKHVKLAEENIHPVKLPNLQLKASDDFDLGAMEPLDEMMAIAAGIQMLSQEEAATLPTSVDYSRIMPQIRNQGARGTCVAFALTAMHEFYRIKESNPQDFSEQFMYYETKLIDGAQDQCGTWIAKAVVELKNMGQCRENIWPYNPNSPCNNHGTEPANARQDASQFKLLPLQLNPKDVNSIKSVLASGRLVCFSIPVFRSWYNSSAVRLTGKITMPLPNEGGVGGHAMCFIGYQDDQNSPGGGYFILRNSWSSQWAANCPYGAGNGTIPYAYIATYNWEAFTSQEIPSSRLVPLYRYWNLKATDHFYTTNWNELRGGAYGWAYEGIQCYVFPTQRLGTVPLYRYWNGKATDHFYTTNWGELGSGRSGWVYEGIQCYVFPTKKSGTVPLYRYWNGNIADHFYTTNWRELGSGRAGWVYEGIQCYVYNRLINPKSSKVVLEVPDLQDETDCTIPGSFKLLDDEKSQFPEIASTFDPQLGSGVDDAAPSSFNIDEKITEPENPDFSASSFKIEATAQSEKKSGDITINFRFEK